MFDGGRGEELAALARAKGLLFGVTYTYSGYTMVKVMREMIAAGRIGRILTVNAEYAQGWLLDQAWAARAEGAQAPWRMDPAASGVANSVGDIGTHVEHIVRYVTGLRTRRLLARTEGFGNPLDLNAHVLLEYAGGVSGAYWISQVAAGRLNGLCLWVYGTEGSLEWAQERPDEVRYTRREKPTEVLARGEAYLEGIAAARGSRLPGGHPEGVYVAFANIYRNFLDVLEKVKAGAHVEAAEVDFPTVGDGLDGVRFVYAVVESAGWDAAWVEMGEE